MTRFSRTSFKENKILSYKFDILFALFYVCLSCYLYFYVFMIEVPVPDATDYLANGHDWLSNNPLLSPYRPPLISWIIAGVWSFTGENWIIIKYLMPIFTVAAGAVLYLTLRRYKGSLFAFAVSAATVLNPQVFFYGTMGLTEGLSLFFVILTLYFVKSERKLHWFLGGITIGLTFASRYPIVIQSLTIFIVECILKKRIEFVSRTIIGMLPVIAIVILLVFLKTGTFHGAIEQDLQFTILLSPYYLVNSINIWGIAFLLVPVALLSEKTYLDKFNYVFIAWFIVSFLFWSANATNQQDRFTIQFSPAVYFLVILAIENIGKVNGVTTSNSISSTKGIKKGS